MSITPWHWAGFILFVLFFLAVDLGLLRKDAKVVSFHEALRWSIFWCTMAMVFAIALYFWQTREDSEEFITGYLIELSLSMDNVFVIALIFSFFRIPPQFQHRVLFWGILGALVMRGAMILAGAALIARFQWLLYAFGAFLVYTGIKMVCANEEGVEP
ncbi:MAG TPA: hypothetical protein VF607_13435, partial [Verrucomicrobiae bacterium]